jgi:hypothetical protein
MYDESLIEERQPATEIKERVIEKIVEVIKEVPVPAKEVEVHDASV